MNAAKAQELYALNQWAMDAATTDHPDRRDGIREAIEDFPKVLAHVEDVAPTRPQMSWDPPPDFSRDSKKWYCKCLARLLECRGFAAANHNTFLFISWRRGETCFPAWCRIWEGMIR